MARAGSSQSLLHSKSCQFAGPREGGDPYSDQVPAYVDQEMVSPAPRGVWATVWGSQGLAVPRGDVFPSQGFFGLFKFW